MQPRPRNDGVVFLVVSLDDGRRKKEDMADLQMRLGLGTRGSSDVANGGGFLGRSLMC